jgi:hypothetical protein
MSRYIDADNLINELSAACMPIYEKGITGILGDNSSIADIINEQPTAVVQEVKRGYWKFNQYSKVVASFTCSECQTRFYNFGNSKILSPTPYCPNCGARMGGVANG